MELMKMIVYANISSMILLCDSMNEYIIILYVFMCNYVGQFSFKMNRAIIMLNNHISWLIILTHFKLTELYVNTIIAFSAIFRSATRK